MSRRFLCFIILSAVVAASGCRHLCHGAGCREPQSERDQLTVRTPMPTDRDQLMLAELDGLLYAIGGWRARPTGLLATVDAYDPATDCWTARAPLFRPRTLAAAAVAAGRLFVLGGSDGVTPAVNRVESYDPQTEAWTRRAPLPTPRSALGAATIDDMIYAVGGFRADGTNSTALEIYDPADDYWTAGPPLPSAVVSAAVVAVAGKLYVIGGVDNIAGVNTYLATVHCYDPVTRAWSAGPPMPTARAGAAGVALDGRIYVAGGFVETGGRRTAGEPASIEFATVEEYDPATGCWRTCAPLPVPVTRAVAAAWGDRFFVMGGTDLSGTRSYDQVLEYLPGGDGR